MPIIDEETLGLTYPGLKYGEQAHILINHDEMLVATNEQSCQVWLAGNQLPFHKKGNGWYIHISDFILETIWGVYLTEMQLEVHNHLPSH